MHWGNRERVLSRIHGTQSLRGGPRGSAAGTNEGNAHSCWRLVRLPREGGMVPVSLLDARLLGPVQGSAQKGSR